MTTSLTKPSRELSQLPERGRAAAEWLDRAFAAYVVATDKERSRQTIAVEATQWGMPMAGSTFYRRLAKWEQSGAVAALPAKLRRSGKGPGLATPTRLPPGFVGFWQELCFKSQRVTEAAYRSLFNDWLLAGKTIPGYGKDWRGILDRDYPLFAGDRDECPFAPYAFHPKGWSSRRLAQLAPSRPSLVAARIGTAEALTRFVPDIPNTRAGVPFGAVWVIDDRVHDQLVTVRRNLHAREVVELGGLELLTGHYTWGMIPALENADGTKQMLRGEYMRYLMAAILCLWGVNKAGCLIAGENATARMGDDLLALLDRLAPGVITFKPGAIMNSPLARGLWLGSAGGNPRWKAPLESIHSYFKNEMAMLPGSKGADPEHCPEQLAQQQRYHVSLMKAAVGIAKDRPDVAELLVSPFPRWTEYRDYIGEIYNRVNRREKHRLEGWEACGFMADYVRLDAPYAEPIERLQKMPDAVRSAWGDILKDEPNRHELRPMSPARAFAHARRRSAERGELLVLPPENVPLILGRALGQVLEVASDRSMVWKDPHRIDPDKLLQAVVLMRDGSRHPLPAHSKWLVHVNPFSDRTAWVSTEEGAVVGTIPVVWAGTKLAPDAETIAGMKRIEAQERSTWARIGQARLSEHAELVGSNLSAFELARGGGTTTTEGQSRSPAERSDDDDGVNMVEEMALAYVETEDLV